MLFLCLFFILFYLKLKLNFIFFHRFVLEISSGCLKRPIKKILMLMMMICFYRMVDRPDRTQAGLKPAQSLSSPPLHSPAFDSKHIRIIFLEELTWNWFSIFYASSFFRLKLECVSWTDTENGRELEADAYGILCSWMFLRKRLSSVLIVFLTWNEFPIDEAQRTLQFRLRSHVFRSSKLEKL